MPHVSPIIWRTASSFPDLGTANRIFQTAPSNPLDAAPTHTHPQKLANDITDHGLGDGSLSIICFEIVLQLYGSLVGFATSFLSGGLVQVKTDQQPPVPRPLPFDSPASAPPQGIHLAVVGSVLTVASVVAFWMNKAMDLVPLIYYKASARRLPIKSIYSLHHAKPVWHLRCSLPS